MGINGNNHVYQMKTLQTVLMGPACQGVGDILRWCEVDKEERTEAPRGNQGSCEGKTRGGLGHGVK